MSEVSANTNDPVNDETAKGSNDNAETNEENAEITELGSDDVQRAIDGLADIPDDQLQEFLDDKDVMEGFDVVDACQGDFEDPVKIPRSERNRDRERVKSSRERSRRDRKSPYSRDHRREDRKRDDLRRDPFKSSKDIERDKIRTRKDNASKILAEKERAIKYLLDSDEVVPPGTEVDVIQNIAEQKQNSERTHNRTRRSRERRRSQDRKIFSPSRRRSNERIRLSSDRRISAERRQIRISPERRRISISPPLRRSRERRASRDRSIERHRRREERELRLAERRSRSRDRQRSRSMDRYRKRWSRSPMSRRSSPRRHSRSRTPDRRPRKRSPFINEIARQLGEEGLLPGGTPSGFLPGIPPLVATGLQQDQSTPIAPQPPPPPLMQQQFMHHLVPPGPPGIHVQGVGQPFVNFDLGSPVNYDGGRGPLLHTPHTDYSAGPIIYNQANSTRSMQQQQQQQQQQPMIGRSIRSMPGHSPQPVPAPGPSDHSSKSFNNNRCDSNIPMEIPQIHMDVTNRTERLVTPEPPVISNSKPFEKTSLSSLLEASVSAKDTLGHAVLYPGFKPEILRQCDLALRDLPTEDVRFKVKGRFFYNPNNKDQPKETENSGSNSLLLHTVKNQIFWDETEKTLKWTKMVKPTIETHQKFCQTDEPDTQSKEIQAEILPKTVEFGQQVYPNDLQQSAKEEKRPIMDRLDWNLPYDYAPKIREADDLRWSLSNSSQKRNSRSRLLSPPLDTDEIRRLNSPSLITLDHGSRGVNLDSTNRIGENFSYKRSSSREHYSHERYSPTYRRSIDHREDFHDVPSNHSPGESPMALEESPEEVEILEEEHYSRSSDWRSRGSTSFGSSGSLHKPRSQRGKSSSRSYHGRGGFRGKF